MKKILSIVALCLIAVLAGTIIVFAFIDKNYNINLKDPDYIQVFINNSETNPQSYYKNDDNEERKEIYDKVIELYNGSFIQKMMSGIFQGIIFDGAEIVYENKSLSSVLSSGTFVAFNYLNDQTLSLNGKVYSYKNDTNIKYNTLYVEVKDTTAMTDINIYVERIDSNTSTKYKYVVKAQQSELYNYLQETFA